MSTCTHPCCPGDILQTGHCSRLQCSNPNRSLIQRLLERSREGKKQRSPMPWGPFCYVNREPHPAPFNKTIEGHRRRVTRLARLREKYSIDDSPDRDDGYFPMDQNLIMPQERRGGRHGQ